MIEIRNISKVYRPKKGVPVKALDEVSLKLPDKGMIFILGKSGSGKSTLLNVLGGLDAYDSGEFIIKGKSSRDFKQSDFDAYRNTFIGFIFQEYNVLDEFSVGANIALAMQLQGKKATDEALNHILDMVDLTGYGNRKPNELSGGQKQRVAIARALIKNPDIIMADEPTGALDSNTGKQVFDTLKKLSRDKLVLVVSHDREFAEAYGDRVIELADGKILSDITKFSSEAEDVKDGFRILDGSVIEIKQGYRLTPSDLTLINDYLARSNSAAILSVDARSNTEFRRAARISDDGAKESFRDTREEDSESKSTGEFRLLHGRLPFRHSFRMGVSGLKVKPFRLFMTILLSCVAFSLFGLADTMAAYNKVDALANSMLDTGTQAAVFRKNRELGDSTFKYYRDTDMTDADIAVIEEKTGMKTFPVVSLRESGYNQASFMVNLADITKMQSQTAQKSYYNPEIFGIYAIGANDLTQLGFPLLAGRLPERAGEVVITNYQFRQFAYCGYRNSTEETKIVDPEDMLSKTISYNTRGEADAFRVVGIADTHDDASAYRKYLPESNEPVVDNLMSSVEQSKMEAYTKYGFHKMLFVHADTVALIDARRDRVNYPLNSGSISASIAMAGSNDYYGAEYAAKASQYGGDIIFSEERTDSKLARNEILLPFASVIRGVSEKMLDVSQLRFHEIDTWSFQVTEYAYSDRVGETETHLYNFLTNYEILAKDYAATAPLPDGLRADAYDWLKSEKNDRNYLFSDMSADDLTEGHLRYYYQRYLTNASHTVLDGWFQVTDPDLGNPIYVNRYGGKSGLHIYNDWWVSFIRSHITYFAIPKNAEFDYRNDIDFFNLQEKLSIAGIYLPDESVLSFDSDSNGNVFRTVKNSLMFSDELYKDLKLPDSMLYEYSIAKLPSSLPEVKSLVRFNFQKTDGNEYRLYNASSVVLNQINDMIESLSKIFLYVGIGFAVFAALMLMNFIATSISYKKREIGILRAVGAKSSDVFGIFFNESLLIAAINFLLSVAIVVGASLGLNGYFLNQSGLALTILAFGIRQIALMLGVSLLVAFISSFLPVFRIARKRPIDAINNR